MRNPSDSMAEATPGDEMPPQVSPMLEVGRSGLKRTGGYVDEEFLPQLRGRKAVQVYREMTDNSPIVGSGLFAIERLLRQIEWRVEAAGGGKGTFNADADFVDENMHDMSHSWGDFIGEILTMNSYGWALNELVYKRRLGPWSKDPKHRSKYSDGKIAWQKIPLRSQETMLRWIFHPETGQPIGMVQMAPPDYKTRVLDLKRCLLFRTTVTKDNPEGRSLLRNAYRPYFMVKRLEEYEAVGVERDLTGLPVAQVPADYLNARPGTEKALMVEAFKKMVTSVRRNEQEGLVLPLEYDDEHNEMFKFSLLTSGGSRQFNTDGIIQRYETRILMTMMADFIMTGHEGSGASYALHTDKSGLFRSAINSLAQSIADVLNRDAIPQLFALNNMKPAELPKIVPNIVDLDLGQLGQFMTSMASAGMQWFPDPEMENFVRDAARVPALNKDVEKIREVEQRQAAMMSLAQQQLQAVQIQAQAAQGQQQMQQAQMAQADPYGQTQQAVQNHGALEQRAGQLAVEAKLAPKPAAAPSKAPAKKPAPTKASK